MKDKHKTYCSKCGRENVPVKPVKVDREWDVLLVAVIVVALILTFMKTSCDEFDAHHKQLQQQREKELHGY